MKKRGSALVYVIAFTSILMVLGTVVSSAVISTTKNNQEHSEIIDLELAAKSGLNIFLEELTKDINYAKNQKDISLLPREITEINSSITNFDGINIIKEITRDEILDKGVLKKYKYTIYSKAIEIGGDAFKEVSQVLIVNINGEGNSGSIEISPVNFINVTNDINLGWSCTGMLDYIAYGNNLTSLDINVNPGLSKPSSSPELLETSISVDMNIIDHDSNKIREEINKYPVVNEYYEISARDINSGVINLNSIINNKDYKDLKIVGDILINYIIDVDIIDKNIFIEGSINNQKAVKLELENSIFRVSGSINSSENIEIELEEYSYVDIIGGIKSNIYNADVKNNSYLSIGGDIINTTDTNIIVENYSVFEVNGNIKSGSPLKFYFNNYSNGLFDESVESNTSIIYDVVKSKVITQGNIETQNFNVNVSDGYFINLGDNINIGTRTKILLKDSIFVHESNFRSVHFEIEMFNSVFVTIGILDIGDSNKFNNKGKSYIFIDGDLKTGGSTNIMGTNDFGLDNQMIKDFIKTLFKVC